MGREGRAVAAGDRAGAGGSLGERKLALAWITGCLGILAGLAVAVVLFAWTSLQTERVRPAEAPTPAPAAVATATLVPPSRPLRPDISITTDQLSAQLKRAAADGRLPLKDPTLTLVPPDRIAVRGNVSVAIASVPTEVEAQLVVDERGGLAVKTRAIRAAGATLPEAVTSAIERQIDEEGTRAIAAALPQGARVSHVTVQPDRVVVELAR